MADRDKVLKGLEMCKIDFCDECPYDDEASCTFYLKHDALELLKEQEPIKPKSKSRHGSTTMYQHFCGNCMAISLGLP